MNRIRTITIPITVTLVADAFGDHVIETTLDPMHEGHQVIQDGERLFSPNTVAVAKRHVAAMILRQRVADQAKAGTGPV
jgi:hypothetical protein